MSDKLAKSFDQHLSRDVGSSNYDRSRLKQRGWADFVDTDYPDTEDPIVMAVGAICYIGSDGDGGWNGERHLISAALSFLNYHLGAYPPEDMLPELGFILQDNPLDSDRLEQWFRDAYRL